MRIIRKEFLLVLVLVLCHGIAEAGLLESGLEQIEQNNYKMAVVLLKVAAEQGNAEAQYTLGITYFNKSEGIEQSNTKAAQWFSIAAKQGHLKAQFLLARMYQKGLGVSQSSQMAFKWMQKSAHQGFNKAMMRLSDYYEIGVVVKKSKYEWEYWLHESAKAGYNEAQYFYGMHLLIDKNQETEAIKWLQSSAENGYTYAQEQLDSMNK